MRTSSALCVVTAALWVASCGGGSASDDARGGARTSQPPAQEAPRAAAAQGRDVSALKACEVVTPQEAAGIIGGRLLSEPPAGFPNCAYVVEVNGTTESYRLVFAEPGLYAATVGLPEFQQKAERLTGLWDEAYVHPREMGEGFSVIAVRRGDIAMEVSGERKEPAIEIAKLAVSQIK
jgi:hypothetical protein